MNDVKTIDYRGELGGDYFFLQKLRASKKKLEYFVNLNFLSKPFPPQYILDTIKIKDRI